MEQLLLAETAGRGWTSKQAIEEQEEMEQLAQEQQAESREGKERYSRQRMEQQAEDGVSFREYMQNSRQRVQKAEDGTVGRGWNIRQWIEQQAEDRTARKGQNSRQILGQQAVDGTTGIG